jgi:hypothetical protein
LSSDDPDLRVGLKALERALKLVITGLAPKPAALTSRPGSQKPASASRTRKA